LNSRQRFRESLLFGNPDKVTLTTHYGPKASLLERWKSQGLPRDRSYVDVDVHGLEPFERLDIFFWAASPIRGEGCSRVRGPQARPELARPDSRIRKNREKSDYVTRKWVEFPVKSRDDFEEMKWRYDPDNPGLYPDDWEEVARSSRDRTYPVNITIPSLFWRVRDWVGLKNLCIMLHRDPDLIHEMMRFWANFVLKLTRRALTDVDVDYVLLCDDMAYKGRAMISPEMMKEFMLPITGDR